MDKIYPLVISIRIAISNNITDTLIVYNLFQDSIFNFILFSMCYQEGGKFMAYKMLWISQSHFSMEVMI